MLWHPKPLPEAILRFKYGTSRAVQPLSTKRTKGVLVLRPTVRPKHGSSDATTFGRQRAQKLRTGYRGDLIEPSPPTEASRMHIERQRTALGEPSAEAIKAGLQIRSGNLNATNYLRHQIAQGEVTTDKIRICLISAWEHISRVPRKQRLDALQPKENPLARTTLDLLWRDSSHWMPVLVYDHGTVAALSYFAVAEGLEDLLTKWLNVDILPDAVDENLRSWNGGLFRCVIAALFMHNTDSTATAPLKYFFDVIAAKDAIKKRHQANVTANGSPEKLPPLASLSVRSATRHIAKELSSGRYPKTDPQLYSRFVHRYESVPIAAAPPVTMAFRRASMRAYQPRSPEPDAMLSFLRSQMDGLRTGAELQRFRDDIPMTDSWLAKLMRHLQFILRKQGRGADALWVKQLAEQLPPGTPTQEYKERLSRADSR